MTDWYENYERMKADRDRCKRESKEKFARLRSFLRDQMESKPYRPCCDGYEAACADVLTTLDKM